MSGGDPVQKTEKILGVVCMEALARGYFLESPRARARGVNISIRALPDEKRTEISPAGAR